MFGYFYANTFFLKKIHKNFKEEKCFSLNDALLSLLMQTDSFIIFRSVDGLKIFLFI